MIRARCVLLLLAAAIVPARASAQAIDIMTQHLEIDLTGMDLVVDVQATIKAVDATQDLLIPPSRCRSTSPKSTG